jgi:hypothetical protein
MRSPSQARYEERWVEAREKQTPAEVERWVESDGG